MSEPVRRDPDEASKIAAPMEPIRTAAENAGTENAIGTRNVGQPTDGADGTADLSDWPIGIILV